MRHTMSSLFASALVGLALAAPVFAQAPDPAVRPPVRVNSSPDLAGAASVGSAGPSPSARSRPWTQPPGRSP